jgi:hypothetical protein
MKIHKNPGKIKTPSTTAQRDNKPAFEYGTVFFKQSEALSHEGAIL